MRFPWQQQSARHDRDSKKTGLETETKSRDSITGNQLSVAWSHRNRLIAPLWIQTFVSSVPL